ncbi:COG4223 family protein [Methylocystis sp. ATCC 49242]|uniref:COG4223 family protein n=1 Tax=Methylocystis sp. ATCC 49242 TaxID=622637 RepID=UPI0001F87337|nr:hypothetical protein [Methylocystis sp. ATCC 49242]
MAGPDADEKDNVPAVEGGAGDAGKTPEAPRKPPGAARRGGGLLMKLSGSALLLLIAIGAGGYGALIFKDKDPRIRLVADYVESGVGEAQSALDKAQASLAELMGETKPAKGSKVTTYRAAPLAQSPEPEKAPEPVKAPEPAKAPERVEKAPEAPAAPAQPAFSAADAVALEARVEATVEASNELARKALQLAESALAAAEAAKSGRAAAPGATAPADAGGFTAEEMSSALEGRIDALGDQLKALADRLDSPKNETRAAPEAEAPKAPAADGAATTVVVAFTLQRELEAGRPYADEIAALTRLGADAGVIASLSPMAEKGAPTGAQLRETFAPIAKRLRAAENHAGGDLAEHLLHGASKLVKVHPTGQPHPETVDGKLDKIDAALVHGDFAAAQAAFESLPEAAQAEGKEFGEMLQQRIAAAKAADDLLHSAIAALGGQK